MAYVDGFLIPVPKNKVKDYVRIATLAGKVWRSHGALQYWECLADLTTKQSPPFARGVKLKKGEVVFFSWIVYKSRAARDKVNAKVMNDPRLAKMMNPESMPFDIKRMGYGGFKPLVKM